VRKAKAFRKNIKTATIILANLRFLKRTIPTIFRIGDRSIGRSLIARSSGLRRIFARNRQARKSLRASISRQSRQGLDWMNFFLADVQTGFGAFVAFYLADLGWSKSQVGLALTVGTLAGVISQIPGGALVDAVRWKRGLAAIGIGMICVSALILALVPSFALVFFAEILHGFTAGIVTPAIAAITLGLVGRRAMSIRTGRNYRFDAAGNALTASLMGLAGQYFAKSAIFLGSAALCIPALIAVSRIRADEIDYARARNAGTGEQATSYHRIFDLGKNRNLYIFAACVFLFQLADASILPIVGENLAQSKTESASLLMAGLIVVPQIVVSLLSPWVGYYSEKWGRKPLLLLGFGLEIVRALLFAFSANVAMLLTAQLLGGISAAAVTVLTILVITDLTTGTGRFNLVRGSVGTLIAIAASISTTATGFIFQGLGHWEGFLTLVGVAVIATTLLWVAMPETKPGKYLD
jgi:MFS family permease